ncbi:MULTISPECIES: outer membrane beta-barrel protein [unclassified Yoonia]|uniref:outer membrane beta-barrel protein n=1 Tax=unclassified Yoonia TaxID=2629118 RepID=UPI002AFF2EA5|nr:MULTISPECIES: outer membrane beta-barrel protein [unclassified Yoonia]
MKVVFAALAALTIASPSHALEAYGAIGGDYALPHAGDADLLVTVLGGVVTTGFPAAFGAEAEFGLALGSGGDFDTRRLRGVARYNFGTLTAFGAVGYDQFVYEDVTDSGLSLGLGGEFDLQENTAFRAEMIRSFIRDGETENTTTTRVGLVYRF